MKLMGLIHRHNVLVLHCGSHLRAHFIINFDHCSMTYTSGPGASVQE